MKALVCLILGLAIGAAGVHYGPRLWKTAPTPGGVTTQPAPQSQPVMALGRIVPAGGIVEIGALPTERIESIDVKPGQTVKAGDKLVELSSYELLGKQIAAIEAKLQEAQTQAAAERHLIDAQIEQAKIAETEANLTSFQIAQQEQQIALLNEKFEQDKTELERLLKGPNSLVSQQDRERQRLAVAKAQAELKAAESNLERMKKSQQLALDNAAAQLSVLERTKERVDAQLPVQSLKAEIDGLKLQQQQALLRARRDGVVLDIHGDVGELVGNSTILRMANLDDMHVVAEVYESALARISDGQSATITSPALAQDLTGKVINKSRVVAAPDVRSIDPYAQSDRRVFEVVIELDKASSALARQIVSAPVDITFAAADSKSRSARSTGASPAKRP